MLALEFGPRKDIVRWANDVMDRHQDREAILITHAYTTPDGRSVHQLLVNFQMRPNGGDVPNRLASPSACFMTRMILPLMIL